nr:radical SAM protein [Candidatus Sigynarchaeota archaeon]
MKPRTEYKPYTVLWDFTIKCNLKCVYCYNDYTKIGEPVAFDQIQYGKTPPAAQPDLTVDQIRSRVLPQFAESDVRSVCFSGGEPLIRWKDLMAIAPDLKDIGIEEVLVATNGTMLTREHVKEFKRAFKGIEPFFLSIPLDSLDPEQVAKVRPPLPNVLERSKAAIDLALKEGMIVTVETVIGRNNIDEMQGIIDYISSKGSTCFSEIYPLFLEGRGKEREDLALMPNDARRFDETRMRNFGKCLTWDHVPFIPDPDVWNEYKEKARIAQITEGCIAGREYIQLDHAGNIYPCSFLRIYCGNMMVDSLKDVWEHNEMLVRFRNRDAGGKCGTCKHNATCGGCRARAYTETGDPFGGVESCAGGPDGHPFEAEFTRIFLDTFKQQYRIVKSLEVLKALHLHGFLRKLGVRG